MKGRFAKKENLKLFMLEGKTWPHRDYDEDNYDEEYLDEESEDETKEDDEELIEDDEEGEWGGIE